jgi:NifU-like protein involved in Fe-S cluster formation
MAQFSVQLDDGVIESVSFKASFCVTLIAYCELLAEWATGATLRRASGIRPADLAVALTCVPPDKRDCAMLAKAALSSAIQTTLEGGST